MNKEQICCICGKKFTGWGNNPWPVVNDPGAECCNDCNNTYVIPARIKMMLDKKEDQ